MCEWTMNTKSVTGGLRHASEITEEFLIGRIRAQAQLSTRVDAFPQKSRKKFMERHV